VVVVCDCVVVVGGGLECVVVVVVVDWVVEEVVAVAVVAVAVGVVGVVVVRQSLAARSLIVEAPWFRFARRVVLTVWGSPATALPKFWLAEAAALQLWAATAELI
jgi:hypothetical protein